MTDGARGRLGLFRSPCRPPHLGGSRPPLSNAQSPCRARRHRPSSGPNAARQQTPRILRWLVPLQVQRVAWPACGPVIPTVSTPWCRGGSALSLGMLQCTNPWIKSVLLRCSKDANVTRQSSFILRSLPIVVSRQLVGSALVPPLCVAGDELHGRRRLRSAYIQRLDAPSRSPSRAIDSPVGAPRSDWVRLATAPLGRLRLSGLCIQRAFARTRRQRDPHLCSPPNAPSPFPPYRRSE